MEHGNFELIISVATTLALLGNAITLVLIYVLLRRITDAAEATRRRLEPALKDAQYLVNNVRDALGDILRDVRTTVRSLTASAEEISDMARTQAREFRALAKDTVLVARNQVEHVDQVLTRTTERFDDTATALQRQILEPVRELHFLVVAVKRAFQVLFARQPRPADPAYQDEELFI